MNKQIRPTQAKRSPFELSKDRYQVYKEMLEERKRLRQLEEIEAGYQVETDDIRDRVGVPSAAIWHQEKIKPR